MTDSELALIRSRDDQAEAEAGYAEGSYGSVAIVARTKTVATYPTAAKSFYALEAVAVFGPETEGGFAARTPDGFTFYGANVGTAIPPTGTEVLVTFVPHRWTFQYD